MSKHAYEYCSSINDYYEFLGRLIGDCKYYLGYGKRNSKCLWAKDPCAQIEEIQMLFDMIPEDARYDFITQADIDDYKAKMCPGYQYENTKRKRRKMVTESYSDIEDSNVWSAYDIAAEYLGYEELCEAIARAMGTDELKNVLRYIFRNYGIPFEVSQEDETDPDYEEDYDYYD